MSLRYALRDSLKEKLAGLCKQFRDGKIPADDFRKKVDAVTITFNFLDQQLRDDENGSEVAK